MEYQTVVLAGLLHDAGKFFQKGRFLDLHVGGKHPEVSAAFIRAFKDTFASVCDAELLEQLVLKHHEHPDYPENLRVDSAPEAVRPLALLVSRADNYSSSERGEADSSYHDYRTRPLDSVFCRLEIGKKTPVMQGYKVAPYAPGHCYPVDITTQEEGKLNNLLQGFGREFAALAKNKPGYDTLYNGLYSLFLKYAWCIPSNSQEKVADVSLFDHLKTTSAIAACLYRYHLAHKSMTVESVARDGEQKFLLVVGDISGIQNYIFSGAAIGVGGLARKLRARSFSINMFSELTAHHLVKALDLPLANIIMSSGGKVYILLPNTEEAATCVNNYQQTVDRWLLDNYQGELAINLAWQSLSGKDFSEFGSVTERVNQKLARKKKMPFSSLLSGSGKWLEEEFSFDITDTQGLGPCAGCGREFAVETVGGTNYGSRCLKEMKLGQLLPRVTQLDITGTSPDISLGSGAGVKLKTGQDEAARPVDLTIVLNTSELPPDRPAVFKYLANHVPLKEGRVMIFDEIAGCSRGVKRLALLKADVDHLGKLFAFGLKEEGTNRDTISRVATFSRMIDLFFSGCVNQLLQDKYSNCYTVFSGGDDLVIIGPWNEVIDLALEIEAEFTRFTGFNPNLTLSAGIALARTRSPVSKAMASAEALLEQAKESTRPGAGENRNQVAIFGKTLSWPALKKLTGEGQMLAGWVNSGKMNKSDLWRLKEYDRLYESYLHENKVEGLLYKAFLAYWIGRNKKDRNADQKLLDWHVKLLENMDVDLESLGALVDYAYCMTREVD